METGSMRNNADLSARVSARVVLKRRPKEENIGTRHWHHPFTKGEFFVLRAEAPNVR